jgi:hypothetical protein
MLVAQAQSLERVWATDLSAYIYIERLLGRKVRVKLSPIAAGTHAAPKKAR